jgi:predicted nucleotidyltransferase
MEAEVIRADGPEVPGSVQAALDGFRQDLRETLGDVLVSVIIYGGVAKGEYNPRTSDVNVMLVLADASVELLDRVAPPVARASRDIPLSLMILTREDLGRATDVFPTKFLDIQRCHRIVHGDDVLSGLEIPREHLRLRCEQEIRNLQLRLRLLYVREASHPELVEGTLSRIASSFLTSLGVLVELRTGEYPPTKAAVVEALERIGLNPAPLRAVLALRSRELRLDAAGLRGLYGDFMGLVAEAALQVDAHQV